MRPVKVANLWLSSPLLNNFFRDLFLVIFSNFSLGYCKILAQSEQPRTPFLNRFQVSVGLGPNVLMGDLGGTSGPGSRRPRDIDMLSTRVDAQLGVRYKFSRYVSAKFFVNGGVLSGNDRYSYNPENKARGLAVESPFFQTGLQGEWYFLPDQSLPKKGFRAEVLPKAISPWSAYGLVGISGIRAFPLSRSGGPPESGSAWMSPALQAGLGAEYWWHPRWSLSLELGYVYAFSDYLDGVKARGNPQEPDGFFFFKVLMNRRFSSKKGGSSGVLCPDFTRGKAPNERSQEGKRMKFGKEYNKKKGSLNVKEYGQ
ncbi:MAG: hypothetical protein NZM15_02605 [Flavobacteriales bacterium]|nr:hypothetical protein [Flavobacteriales bacterium]MDW8431578.1 hypothetical protein [Flavobacteriales bacterium]